jgi:hypothetical protein
MTNRISVLVMCLSDPSGDPRPYRAINLCNEMGADVHAISFPYKKNIPITNHYTLRIPSTATTQKLLRKLLVLFSILLPFTCFINKLNEMRYGILKVQSKLKGKKFDLIIVEDLYLLPFALKIKSNAKIIFDAREYYTEQSSDNLIWRLTERRIRIKLCKNYLSKCDQIITVSPGLADAYKNNFGVECKLIRSAPYYSDIAPTSPNSKIRMIHHGGAMRARKLENMINMFKFLDDRFTLDFCLVGDDVYTRELKELAAPYKQIRFCEPVEFLDIGKMLSTYDIGLYLFEPTSFNALHALPNKFFEFIQSRLMLAIGPSPDMASLLNEYQCGIVSVTFKPEDLAKKLNALSIEKITEYKNNADKAAKELCWENESKKYIDIINTLIKDGAHS